MNIICEKPIAEFITVTPEIAKNWLELNIENRRHRGWWSSALANMIRRGEWIVSHQGIAFSKSGILIDGQHRLHSIVESQTPVEILVTRGLSEDAYKVIDTGMKRTLSDLTGISVRSSEVCRHLARMVHGGSVTTAMECEEVYKCGVGEVAEELQNFCSTSIKIFSSVSVRVGAICLILDGHDKNYIKNLYANLCHQKYKELPPIAESFVRQANDKRINANSKADLLARSLKVFNPQFENIQKLIITDADCVSANAYCRNIVKNLLAKNEIY
jgi:hypothetical protein